MYLSMCGFGLRKGGAGGEGGRERRRKGGLNYIYVYVYLSACLERRLEGVEAAFVQTEKREREKVGKTHSKRRSVLF